MTILKNAQLTQLMTDQGTQNLMGGGVSQNYGVGGLPFINNSMNHLGGIFNQQQQMMQASMNPLMFQNQMFGLQGMMGTMPQLGLGMGMNQMNNQANINQIKSENAALGGFPAPRLAIKEVESEDDNLVKKRKITKKAKLVKLKKLDMVLNKAIKPHANRITRNNRQQDTMGDPRLLSNEKNFDRFMRKIMVLVKNEYRGGLMLAEGNKIPNAYLREPDDRLDELVEKGAMLVDKFINRYDDLEAEDISLCSLNSQDSDDDCSMSDDSYSMSTADIGNRMADPVELVVPVLPRRDAPAGGGLAVPILPRRQPGDAPPPSTNPRPGPPPPPLIPTYVKDSTTKLSKTAPLIGTNVLSIGMQTKSEVVPPHIKLQEATPNSARKGIPLNDQIKAPPGESPKNLSGPIISVPKTSDNLKNKQVTPQKAVDKPNPKLLNSKKQVKQDSKTSKVKPPVPAKVAAVSIAQPSVPLGPSNSELLLLKEIREREEAQLSMLHSEQVIDEFHRLNPEVIVFLEKCLKNSKNALKLQDDSKLKKSITRDDGTAPKQKKKMKKGHKANELSNELVLSEICYDDTFMQEVSINIIPPSSTGLKIDKDEDDFSSRKPKNRLLPKKAKGRKR